MKGCCRALFILVWLLFSPFWGISQSNAEEKVFVVKAKDLPVTLLPRTDTLVANRQQHFLLAISKSHQVDTITCLNCSVKHVGDSLWLTAAGRAGGITYWLGSDPTNSQAVLCPQAFLKITGHKQGSKNQLSFSKKFVVIQYPESRDIRPFGYGMIDRSTRDTARPQPQMICFMKERNMRQPGFYTPGLLDSIYQYGFSVRDTAAHQEIAIQKMVLHLANNWRNGDTALTGELTDTMKAHLSTAPDLTAVYFEFTLANGRKSGTGSNLRKYPEPALWYSDRFLDSTFVLHYKDVTSAGKNLHYFTLGETGADSSNYMIKTITVTATNGSGKNAKKYKAVSNNGRIPNYVFNNIRKQASVQLDFVLVPKDPGLKRYQGLGLKRSYTVAYVKKG